MTVFKNCHSYRFSRENMWPGKIFTPDEYLQLIKTDDLELLIPKLDEEVTYLESDNNESMSNENVKIVRNL